MKRLLALLLVTAIALVTYADEKKPVDKNTPKAAEKKAKPPVDQKAKKTPDKKTVKPIEKKAEEVKLSYDVRFIYTHKSLYSLRNAVEIYRSKTGFLPSANLSELVSVKFRVLDAERTILGEIPAELISSDKAPPVNKNPSNRKVVTVLGTEGGWFFDTKTGKVHVNYNKVLGEEWGVFSGQNPAVQMNIKVKPVEKPVAKPVEKPTVKKISPENEPGPYGARYSATRQNLESLRNALMVYVAKTGMYPGKDLKELFTAKIQLEGKQRTLLNSIPPELLSSDNAELADKNPPNRNITEKSGAEGGWYYDLKNGRIYVNYNKPLGSEWGKHAGENPSKW